MTERKAGDSESITEIELLLDSLLREARDGNKMLRVVRNVLVFELVVSLLAGIAASLH